MRHWLIMFRSGFRSRGPVTCRVSHRRHTGCPAREVVLVEESANARSGVLGLCGRSQSRSVRTARGRILEVTGLRSAVQQLAYSWPAYWSFPVRQGSRGRATC
jgi:hypothetical protein